MASTASRSGNRSQNKSFSFTLWLIMLGAALLIAFGILAFLHLIIAAIFVLSALLLEIGIVAIVLSIKTLASKCGYGQNSPIFDCSRSELIISTFIGLVLVAASVGTIFVVAAGLASASLALLTPILPTIGGILLAIGVIFLLGVCMFECCCPQPGSSNRHISSSELAGEFRAVPNGSSLGSVDTLNIEPASKSQKTDQDLETSSRKSSSTHQSDIVKSLRRHSFVPDTSGTGSNDLPQQSAEQLVLSTETDKQVAAFS